MPAWQLCDVFSKDRIVFKVPFMARPSAGSMKGKKHSGEDKPRRNSTLNTNNMKNTIKKLPFLLAFVVTIFAASCSDITVEPLHTDGAGGGIIIPPPSGTTTSSDSTTIG